jgi:hypothetical protein
MARPWEYPTLHVLSGFVQRPLNALLGGDVAIIRSVWQALFLAAATAMARAAVIRSWPAGSPLTREVLWPLSLTLGAGSFAFLTLWLPTPHYNSVNFAGICLFAAGLLSLPRAGKGDGAPGPLDRRPRPLAQQLMMAVGTWLAFMGRPFTAAALVIIAIASAAFHGRAGLRGLLVPALAGLALLGATSVITDGSPAGLALRFTAAASEGVLAGSHSPTALLILNSPAPLRLLENPFSPLFIILFLYGYFLWPGGAGRGVRGPLALVLPPAALALGIFANRNYLWHSSIAGHLLWAPAFGCVCRAAVFGWRTRPRPEAKPGLLAPLALLAVFPAYALSSNNFVAVATAPAGLFAALGLIALLPRLMPPEAWPGLLVRLAWATLFVSMAIVVTSSGNPYRQADPLYAQAYPATFPAGGGTLLLSKDSAGYLTELEEGAAMAGYVPGTPVFDLSGRVPGSVDAIGGYLPKTLWVRAGYPGSQRWAALALARLTCAEVASAWLLEDTDPAFEPLNPGLLYFHGARFPDDYAPVARAVFVGPLPSGFTSARYHVLHKPRRPLPEAEAACRAARDSF